MGAEPLTEAHEVAGVGEAGGDGGEGVYGSGRGERLTCGRGRRVDPSLRG